MPPHCGCGVERADLVWLLEVRNLFDVKIFVDTDPDTRLARRLRRDIVHRGRDVLQVSRQPQPPSLMLLTGRPALAAAQKSSCCLTLIVVVTTQVLDQYERTVKPSFESYISPTKKYADIIVGPWCLVLRVTVSRLYHGCITCAVLQIPRGSENTVALDLILQHIKFRLGSKLTAHPHMAAVAH